MEKLVDLLKDHDLATYYHSKRVADLSSRIAKNMNLAETEQQIIYYSGLLHDIGKLKVDKEILNKPAKLTKEEWLLIQQHPIFGYEMLNQYYLFDDEIKHVVLYHHERIDGSGYPFKLSGQEIPLKAQIVAIADSFDAMTNTRAYSQAKSVNQALDQLLLDKGCLFNPIVADTLVELLKIPKNMVY